MTFELSQIVEITKHAGEAFKAAKEGLATGKAVKALFNKSEPPKVDELKSAISDLVDKVFNAASANMELQSQLVVLQEDLIQMKRLQDQLGMYFIYTTQAGDVVYRLSEAERRTKPDHLVCPTCYNAGRISFLNGGHHIKMCHPCKVNYSIIPRSEEDSRYGFDKF